LICQNLFNFAGGRRVSAAHQNKRIAVNFLTNAIHIIQQVVIVVVGNLYGGNGASARAYSANLAFLYVYLYLARFGVAVYGFVRADGMANTTSAT
jgi:hypothetical protein